MIFENILSPFIISVLSLIGGAVIAINLNYASNKLEAIDALISLGKSTAFFIYRVLLAIGFLYLVYQLWGEMVSDKDVTREVLIRVTVLVISILVMFFLSGFLLILDLVRKINKSQMDHLKITDQTLKVLSERDSSKNET
jgi:hypothetical protein